jgi:hypothetical protein
MIRAALFLTPDEWTIIEDWLEHGRVFEADSQNDVAEFRWPEVSGALLLKMDEALRRGERVILCPDRLGLATNTGASSITPAAHPSFAHLPLRDAIKMVLIRHGAAMTAPAIAEQLLRGQWLNGQKMQSATLVSRVRNELSYQAHFRRVARGLYALTSTTDQHESPCSS